MVKKYDWYIEMHLGVGQKKLNACGLHKCTYVWAKNTKMVLVHIPVHRGLSFAYRISSTDVFMVTFASKGSLVVVKNVIRGQKAFNQMWRHFKNNYD